MMNQTNWKEADWKQYVPEFREKTEAFYEGRLSKAEYKGFSGFYGSYAQRSGQASMLRLRMPSGRITKDRLDFVLDTIRKYHIDCIHFTTCETIQLHNLKGQDVSRILEDALDAGIVPMGGGGDFPRNVLCSPLTGIQKEEYFDVRPWAEAAGDYLMGFILAEKMPRKLKVCFSNSADNLPHATCRDLGFAAAPDGTFDVYSAGGLGNHPMMGVKVGEHVDPSQILYYIKAMWLTFRTYGNYENRGKARTRYMQEKLGGPQQYAQAFQEKLEEVYASGENLTVDVKPELITKKGDGVVVDHPRALPQKQEGLYCVVWHPIGGIPNLETLFTVADLIADMPEVEFRLGPDETAYIINLNGTETEQVLAVTGDGARTWFETSVACIGASVCQVGVRDSQKLLRSCIQAVREAGITDGALPQVHISGCPSSCGTHQIGVLGFRGASKTVDKKPQSAFMLTVNGWRRQGEESFGREIGTMLETDIPKFLVKLGKIVEESGLDYDS